MEPASARNKRIDVSKQELHRLYLEQYPRAESDARSRIATLSSVVLGLSLLALQIKNPTGTNLILFAWISLGGAVILSAFQSLIVVSAAKRMSRESLKSWITNNSTKDQLTNVLNKSDEFVSWVSVVALTSGVVLLILFASKNI